LDRRTEFHFSGAPDRIIRSPWRNLEPSYREAEGKPIDALTRAFEIARLIGPVEEPSETARRREKTTGALGYARVESGLAVPLMAHTDRMARPVRTAKSRSQQKFEQSINALVTWLKARNLPLLFETVDRKRRLPIPRSRNSATAIPRPPTRCCRGCAPIGHGPSIAAKSKATTHWRAVKSFAKRQAKSDRQRAFRDEELKALFAPKDGETERMRRQLLPLMSLAVASGARLSELCALRVRDVLTGQALKHKCDDLEIRRHADCPNGAFFFRVDGERGKTASAERLTPIHSGIPSSEPSPS
jgi:integrase